MKINWKLSFKKKVSRQLSKSGYGCVCICGFVNQSRLIAERRAARHDRLARNWTCRFCAQPAPGHVTRFACPVHYIAEQKYLICKAGTIIQGHTWNPHIARIFFFFIDKTTTAGNQRPKFPSRMESSQEMFYLSSLLWDKWRRYPLL